MFQQPNQNQNSQLPVNQQPGLPSNPQYYQSIYSPREQQYLDKLTSSFLTLEEKRGRKLEGSPVNLT